MRGDVNLGRGCGTVAENVLEWVDLWYNVLYGWKNKIEIVG